MGLSRCPRLFVIVLLGVLQMIPQSSSVYQCGSPLTESIEVEGGENILLVVHLQEDTYDPGATLLWKNGDVLISSKNSCSVDDSVLIRCWDENANITYTIFHLAAKGVDNSRIQILEILIANSEYEESGYYNLDMVLKQSSNSEPYCRILTIKIVVETSAFSLKPTEAPVISHVFTNTPNCTAFCSELHMFSDGNTTAGNDSSTISSAITNSSISADTSNLQTIADVENPLHTMFPGNCSCTSPPPTTTPPLPHNERLKPYHILLISTAAFILSLLITIIICAYKRFVRSPRPRSIRRQKKIFYCNQTDPTTTETGDRNTGTETCIHFPAPRTVPSVQQFDNGLKISYSGRS